MFTKEKNDTLFLCQVTSLTKHQSDSWTQMFGHQLTAKLSLDVKTSGVQIRWNKEPEEKGKKKGLQ